MKLLVSAIAAGGVLGAADQYMCLLIVSVLAKTGVISLTPQMGFMESWWFIGIVALFWLLTVAPAYAALLGPGVMNAINTAVSFLSGFLVPASAAMMALASVGVIVDMHPDLVTSLRALQLFDMDGDGTIGGASLLVAGGSALTASALTGVKFLAKPAIGTVTGTEGTISAPIYATVENVASVILMGLFYVLLRIDPWLLVGLVALLALLFLAVLGFALYKLWKLAKGVGRVIQLVEKRPKVGLSIVLEFLVWGAGRLAWRQWSAGAWRLVLWALWLAVIFIAIPALATALGALLVAAPPLMVLAPILGTMAEAVVVVAGLYVGLRSARSLMKMFDEQEGDAIKPAPAAAAAQQPSVF